MRINSQIRLDPYILKAVTKAGSLLNNRKAVINLIGSASAKIESGGGRVASIKNDLGTVIELLKAWTRGEYREVPWTTLLLGTGAVIYFVNPFDAIPDILPAAGLLDDASVLGFVLASAKNDIEKFRRRGTGASHPDNQD